MQLESEFSGRIEDAQAFGNDFGADTVAGDDGDAVCFGHVRVPFR